MTHPSHYPGPPLIGILVFPEEVIPEKTALELKLDSLDGPAKIKLIKEIPDKAAFELKLESFDAPAKIRLIKEIRSYDIIYSAWLASARRKYSELVSLARGKWEYHKKRDDRIGMNVYLSWVEFWKTEDFKTKSSIQKGNRRSGVDGHLSTHTSGSASYKKVAARLNIQYKHKPTADQVFFEVHTRHLKKKKNLIGETGENGMDNESDEVETIWIDKKSEQTYWSFDAPTKIKTSIDALDAGQAIGENIMEKMKDLGAKVVME
ncbi:hypothetical protein POM88_022461 [Heracleum sosnowskyi]|uniref:Uncharacterized protein n=1 Tax=Heracleum sosnowskyi TaxID=360622 RepID=A0AAD8IFV9_9APIA|nr:hypothetical protein POM88_022461 [Heracleum sosnowskyi]